MTHLQPDWFRPTQLRWAALAVGVTAVITLAGCANPSASSGVYTYGQAQREQVTYMGTVLGVRDVIIQPESSTGVGTIAGAAIGGVAASTIGGGTGRTLATIVGGLAGGLAGTAVEREATRKKGYEITVRLDSGETRVITQEADVPVHAGQRVQIITGSGVTRVVPVR